MSSIFLQLSTMPRNVPEDLTTQTSYEQWGMRHSGCRIRVSHRTREQPTGWQACLKLLR